MMDDPLASTQAGGRRRGGRLPHEVDRRLRETFEPERNCGRQGGGGRRVRHGAAPRARPTRAAAPCGGGAVLGLTIVDGRLLCGSAVVRCRPNRRATSSFRVVQRRRPGPLGARWLGVAVRPGCPRRPAGGWLWHRSRGRRREMTRTARLLVAVALTCAAPQAAMAQDTARQARVARISKAMAPAEVFKVLADAVGRKVTVDPAVTTPVDILVRNVSARTALNTICESIGCRWTADADGIVITPGRPGTKPGSRTQAAAARGRLNGDSLRVLFEQPLPPGMKFENAPLETVSARLSEALKTQIAISTDDKTPRRLPPTSATRPCRQPSRRCSSSPANARSGASRSPDVTVRRARRSPS